MSLLVGIPLYLAFGWLLSTVCHNPDAEPFKWWQRALLALTWPVWAAIFMVFDL